MYLGHLIFMLGLTLTFCLARTCHLHWPRILVPSAVLRDEVRLEKIFGANTLPIERR